MKHQTYQDPVVEEVRERGRRFTERYGNDAYRIFEHFREEAHKYEDRIVSDIRVVRIDKVPSRGADTPVPALSSGPAGTLGSPEP